MEYYKAILKEDTTGVYAISLVEQPAMESEFLALSKQPELIQFKTVDEEKRILLGAVLIPDKPIYRNQNGREFYVQFPTETIQMAQEGFFKNGYQNNSTYEHEEQMQFKGVTVVESWIKEDEVNDKSVKYGINEPVGTWFAKMKINNQEIWDEYVKTGLVKGFSIDGYFDMEKINLNIHTMSNENKNLIDAFTAALKSVFKPETKEEIKLGQMQNANEDLIIYFEGEMATLGQEVWLQDENGEKMPVPDGEYPMENDLIWIVVDSKIQEFKEPEQEDATSDEAPAELADEGKPQIKSEKVTQEVFYQLTKEDLAEMAKTFGQMISEVRTELKAAIQSKLSENAESVQLTKNKDNGVEVLPTTTKGRLLKAIKNVKN